MSADPPIVFISYSHDSDAHRKRVLSLSESLRADGIETILDQYVNGTPAEGWPRWMLDGLDRARFVLVTCTETYYRRFRGHETPGIGKGVDWEGALITLDLYHNRSITAKFVPVLWDAADQSFVPEPLSGHTCYTLTSEEGYQALYAALREVAGVEPGKLGPLKPLARPTGRRLSFEATSARVEKKTDISRIDRYVPAELIGREEELRRLNDAWDQVVRGVPGRPHIITVVALGGEGKTSLAGKWAADLAARDWPGCDAAFAWSFYSQGTREQMAASSDLFLNEALTFFGDPETAASAAGAFEKGQRLARLVGSHRALLILDGLEPLQYSPTSPTPGELKDRGLAALLKALAGSSSGLCLITTRYEVRDLRPYAGKTVHEEKLARLSRAAGVALLQSFGLKGSLRRNLPGAAKGDMWNEFEKLVEDVHGHALTLNLLGSYLRDAHGGDIRQRDRIKLTDTRAGNEHGRHAFHVMDAYVRWLAPGGWRGWWRCLFSRQAKAQRTEGARALALLRLLGLFDRPATVDCLQALWRLPAIPSLTGPLMGLTDEQRNILLKRLEDAKLLTVNRDPASSLLSIDAHPLLREYFAQSLRDKQPEACRAAHQRLYEHLCASTTADRKPDATLEDLQPLYQAVTHGCLAGLEQEVCDEVYFRRISRGSEAYVVKKLGAFGSDLGAVACFFEVPWSRVSSSLTAGDQAWLLNQAAFRLRALGRLTEALEPVRAGVEMRIQQENWEEAAISASNLSALELTLGLVSGAVTDAASSVIYADRSGDAFQRLSKRSRHADALHQAGKLVEAGELFRAAEVMQAEWQPEYPLLYSVQGFQYCDLLLVETERAAWQAVLGSARVSRAVSGVSPDTPGADSSRALESPRRDAEDDTRDACAPLRAVFERATQTLQWAEQNNVSLLSLALDHLTLSRVALYRMILVLEAPVEELMPEPGLAGSSLLASSSSPEAEAKKHLAAAVVGLRRAGDTDELPRGLLSRAWLRFLTGARTGHDSAQEDLDEAWEIAERGSMKLFLADVLLDRARLFGLTVTGREMTSYPWSSSPAEDLAAARKLIVDCGYGRRREELEDAEAVLRDL